MHQILPGIFQSSCGTVIWLELFSLWLLDVSHTVHPIQSDVGALSSKHQDPTLFQKLQKRRQKTGKAEGKREMPAGQPRHLEWHKENKKRERGHWMGNLKWWHDVQVFAMLASMHMAKSCFPLQNNGRAQPHDSAAVHSGSFHHWNTSVAALQIFVQVFRLPGEVEMASLEIYKMSFKKYTSPYTALFI